MLRHCIVFHNCTFLLLDSSLGFLNLESFTIRDYKILQSRVDSHEKENMFVIKLSIDDLYLNRYKRNISSQPVNGGLSVVATHPELVEADVFTRVIQIHLKTYRSRAFRLFEIITRNIWLIL